MELLFWGVGGLVAATALIGAAQESARGISTKTGEKFVLLLLLVFVLAVIGAVVFKFLGLASFALGIVLAVVLNWLIGKVLEKHS